MKKQPERHILPHSINDDQFTTISKQIAGLNQQNEKFEERFAAHDKRFDAIDARLAAHDKALDRIAAEVAKKADKADVDARFDKLDANFDRVFGVLDTILKTLETHEYERLASNHQLDRHDIWIHQLAAEANMRLSPEA